MLLLYPLHTLAMYAICCRTSMPHAAEFLHVKSNLENLENPSPSQHVERPEASPTPTLVEALRRMAAEAGQDTDFVALLLLCILASVVWRKKEVS